MYNISMKIIIYVISLLSILYPKSIIPIPLHVEGVDTRKAKLGKELFFDMALSKDGTISCAICHALRLGGDDNQKVSIGIKGQKGNINAPTVLNARYNFVQFWNGRAKDLKEQVSGPIENPKEMGNNFPNLVKTLNKYEYKEEFKLIYKDAITKENIIDAIVQYEKTLVTPNAPFDKFLRGDIAAINKDAKKGYKLFKSKGCIKCHNGINIGGNMYAKFGEFKESKSPSLGRYEVSKNKKDKYYFKVPTLRNIEKTAPYLHDGRFDSLSKVVRFMLNTKLENKSTKKEIHDIVEFLKSLNGKVLNM